MSLVFIKIFNCGSASVRNILEKDYSKNKPNSTLSQEFIDNFKEDNKLDYEFYNIVKKIIKGYL